MVDEEVVGHLAEKRRNSAAAANAAYRLPERSGWINAKDPIRLGEPRDDLMIGLPRPIPVEMGQADYGFPGQPHFRHGNLSTSTVYARPAATRSF